MAGVFALRAWHGVARSLVDSDPWRMHDPECGLSEMVTICPSWQWSGHPTP